VNGADLERLKAATAYGAVCVWAVAAETELIGIVANNTADCGGLGTEPDAAEGSF
jgi:hypothetical protein